MQLGRIRTKHHSRYGKKQEKPNPRIGPSKLQKQRQKVRKEDEIVSGNRECLIQEQVAIDRYYK